MRIVESGIVIAAVWMTFVIHAQPSAVQDIGDQVLNIGCINPAENEVRCPMHEGLSRYRLLSQKTQFLHLTNSSNVGFALEQVLPFESQPNVPFREYCISLNGFATSQSSAGIGEVACRTKHNADRLPKIAFGGQGLFVAPGDSLFMASSPADSEPWIDIQVDLKQSREANTAWRLPHFDKSIACEGRLQATEVNSWRNETKKELKLHEALIYAESGTPSRITKVDRACLQILNESDHPRFQTCNGLNHEGAVQIDATLAAGERITAFAENNCLKGGVWDWVIYLFLKEQP